MTPEEKAKELVDKYDFDHNEFDYSKEYALIAVDEIYNSRLLMMVEDEQYWYDVKQEINKL